MIGPTARPFVHALRQYKKHHESSLMPPISATALQWQTVRPLALEPSRLILDPGLQRLQRLQPGLVKRQPVGPNSTMGMLSPTTSGLLLLSFLRVGLRPSVNIATETPPQNSWGQRFHTMPSRVVGLILKGSGQIALGFNPRETVIREPKPRTGRWQSTIANRRRPVGTHVATHDTPQVETCGYMPLSRWDKLRCGA